jgi:hypothetical protein
MKKDLIRKLESAYAALAMLPAPSRLVEALFVWGDTSDKEVIAGALACHLRQLQVFAAAGPASCSLNPHSCRHAECHLSRTLLTACLNSSKVSRQQKQKQVLQGSKFGASLCQVCQLDVWARSPEEWRRRVTDNERTAAQYLKLFGDAPVGRNKREKKKRKWKEETGSRGGADGGKEEAVRQKTKGWAQDVAGEVMTELGIARGNGGRDAAGRDEGGLKKGRKKGKGYKEGKGKQEAKTAQELKVRTVKGKVDKEGKETKVNEGEREGERLKAKAHATKEL